MNISLYNQETSHGILQMEIEKSDYIDKVEKGLRNIRMTANVAGFRKGMAPIGIVKNLYGKQILLDELNKILGESLKTYFQNNPDIKLIGSAILNHKSFNNGDLDSNENITVIFDLPMSPKVDIELSKDDVLPYMRIVPEEEWINMQLEKHRMNYGDYVEEVDTVSGNVLVTGKMVELENNGMPKQDGITVEEAIFQFIFLKNGEEAAKFADLPKGSVVVFNPRKAFEGSPNVNYEISMLLSKAQKEVEKIDSDFSFEITSIMMFQQAPLDQQFFDNILGQDVVSNVEDFMEEFKSKLTEMFVPESDYRLMEKLRPYLLNKAGELPIDEDLLKHQILSDEEASEAEIDANMPETLKDIRSKLIIDHILERYNTHVTKEDLEKKAYVEAQRMLLHYGFRTPDMTIAQSYAADMLKNSKTVHHLTASAKEDKLLMLAKELITLDIKEVSVSELDIIRRSEADEPAAE